MQNPVKMRARAVGLPGRTPFSICVALSYGISSLKSITPVKPWVLKFDDQSLILMIVTLSYDIFFYSHKA